MRQSNLRRLWIFLFATTLAMTCIATIRFAQGQGPFLVVTGFLASDCLLIAHMFKRAIIVLWILAFIFLMITLFLLFAR